MKIHVPLFEEFTHQMEAPPEEGWDGPNQHMTFMQWLASANADEIRQVYLEGKLNSDTKKMVAARTLSHFVEAGTADDETVRLFHELADEQMLRK
jgi:hypothetical protein